MKNPFLNTGKNPFGLTDEQIYYPFNSMEEKDAALESTLDAILPVIGGPARSMFGLLGKVAHAGMIKDYMDGILESIRKYFENMFGQVISEISIEAIMEAAGKAFAEELGKQLLKRYGISFPIANVLSDTLMEEIGEWVADLVNDAISKKVGYQVTPFTTMFPYENVPNELDAFVSEGINTALGTNLTSVMNISTLKTEVENAVFTQITNMVNEQLAIAKGNVMQNLEYEISRTAMLDGVPHYFRQAVAEAIGQQMSNLTMNLNNLMPSNLKARKFYFTPTKRLGNKLRQRKWRETHRQQTNWVVK